MSAIGVLLTGVTAHEGLLQLGELQMRHRTFNMAQDHANNVKKPLLVIGTPKHAFSHPCGDVTLDIDPGNGYCDVEIADVRAIPYPNEHFGAAFCSHVLEHLATVDDALLALAELERVAGKVFIVSPHKSSIIAWMYPGHHLWITETEDGFKIEQRGG